MNAAVEVRGFWKLYDKTVAVAELSFSLRPGEVLGLVGPNGAGKTTTLRALAGIAAATKGQLFIAGCDLAAQPVAAKQQLAYIPDEPRLFDALTVAEHLEFAASAYRVADYQPKAEALLRCFELTEKRESLAQELSRGMRQKVAIACAYLHDPQVILFDEPLTGLDPRGIRILKSSITERAAAGAAVIVSSHLLDLVEDLCTHLLILDRGRQRFCGSVADARERFGAGGGSLEDVFFRATDVPVDAIVAESGSDDAGRPGADE
jgi:ABC-2 type transport system ATP-binding protein